VRGGGRVAGAAKKRERDTPGKEESRERERVGEKLNFVFIFISFRGGGGTER
jgi:hypothetical protein